MSLSLDFWNGMSQIREIEPHLTDEKPESQRSKGTEAKVKQQGTGFRNQEGTMIPTKGFFL